MKKILESKITTIILGVVLISYGVLDLYEELLEPAHEHILILIGILLVLNAIGHTHEGVHNIAHAVKEDKEFRLLERIGRFFRHPVVRIVLGLAVLITSLYGLYDDIEKIHSKSVSMGVGILMMILPLVNIYMGGKNVSKGIKRDRAHE